MLNYDVVADGLTRFTNWWSVQGVWNCGMAFTVGPVFEEAYVVRGTIKACKVLNLGRGRDVAHSFCDRAMLTQGAVEENMYYMGYGNNRSPENGLPNCSCVADASSSAAVFVETIKAYPDSPKCQEYIKSLKQFTDYVIEKYISPQGIIQVGILGHRRDVLPDYWCANVLFSEVLVGLGEITGQAKYLDAAQKAYEYIATLDYKNMAWKEWETRPTHVEFYAGEGVLSGILSQAMQSRLNVKFDINHKSKTDKDSQVSPVVQEALNRVKAEQLQAASQKADDGSLRAALIKHWNVLYERLFQIQQPTGIWHTTHDDRCYQCGLSWLLIESLKISGNNKKTFAMIDRQLSYLTSNDAKLNFGMFAEPFGTGLALVSFAAAAEFCQNQDAARFEQSLRQAKIKLMSNPW